MGGVESKRGGGVPRVTKHCQAAGINNPPVKSTTLAIYDPLSPKDGTELIPYVILHIFNIQSESLAVETAGPVRHRGHTN